MVKRHCFIEAFRSPTLYLFVKGQAQLFLGIAILRYVRFQLSKVRCSQRIITTVVRPVTLSRFVERHYSLFRGRSLVVPHCCKHRISL